MSCQQLQGQHDGQAQRAARSIAPPNAETQGRRSSESNWGRHVASHAQQHDAQVNRIAINGQLDLVLQAQSSSIQSACTLSPLSSYARVCVCDCVCSLFTLNERCGDACARLQEQGTPNTLLVQYRTCEARKLSLCTKNAFAQRS